MKSARVQLEVDFVVNRGNQRYYIQSALSIADPEKRKQEINSLKADVGGFLPEIERVEVWMGNMIMKRHAVPAKPRPVQGRFTA